MIKNPKITEEDWLEIEAITKNRRMQMGIDDESWKYNLERVRIKMIIEGILEKEERKSLTITNTREKTTDHQQGRKR